VGAGHKISYSPIIGRLLPSITPSLEAAIQGPRFFVASRALLLPGLDDLFGMGENGLYVLSFVFEVPRFEKAQSGR
jgi:hypothetical protein